MKRLLPILFPAVAVLGCGKVSSRFISLMLSGTYCALLISAGALSSTPLLESSGVYLFPLAGLLWLAAGIHALSVVQRDSFQARSKEEEAQLVQQTELMKIAAARRVAARKNANGTPTPQAPSAIQPSNDS